MKYLAIVLALVLAGCKTPAPEVRVETVEVRVPVLVPIPAPPVTKRPDLVIFQLTQTDKADPGVVSLAYQASIKQLQGYVLQLEAIVEGYRDLSKERPNEGK